MRNGWYHKPRKSVFDWRGVERWLISMEPGGIGWTLTELFGLALPKIIAGLAVAGSVIGVWAVVKGVFR